MITNKHDSTEAGSYKVLRGLSTDSKPTGVANGSQFVEIDTGKAYLFNEDGAAWVEQPASGGGTSDYTDLENKPSINGVTLNGNKTLADLGNRFIITLTENNGTWTADKTSDEINAAYNAGKALFVSAYVEPFEDIGATVLAPMVCKHGNSYDFATVNVFYGVSIVAHISFIGIWDVKASVDFDKVIDIDNNASLLTYSMQVFVTFLTAAVQNGGAFTSYNESTTDSSVLSELYAYANVFKIAVAQKETLIIKLGGALIPATVMVNTNGDGWHVQFLLQGTDDSSGSVITYLAQFTLGFTESLGNVSSVNATAAGFAKM